MSNPAGTDDEASLFRKPWNSRRLNSYGNNSTNDDAGSHLALPTRTPSRASRHLGGAADEGLQPPVTADSRGNIGDASTAGSSDRRISVGSSSSPVRKIVPAVPLIPAIPRKPSVNISRTNVVAPPNKISTITENPLSPDAATFGTNDRTAETVLDTAKNKLGGSTTIAQQPASALGEFSSSESVSQSIAGNGSNFSASLTTISWRGRSQVGSNPSRGGPPRGGNRAGINSFRIGHQAGLQTAPPTAEWPLSSTSTARHIAGPQNNRHYKDPSDSGHVHPYSTPAHRRRRLSVQNTEGATRAQYQVGMILRAFLHEEYRPRMLAASLSRPGTDVSRTKTTQGPYVFSKHRPMIVVALFENHYVVVPLFTHRGQGLQYVKNPDEYVSIRDHRSTEPFTRLSRHKPLVTDSLSIGLEPNTTAWITYPVSRLYDLESELCGFLNPASTSRLVALYTEHPEATMESVTRMNITASKQFMIEQLEAAKDEARQTDQRISEIKATHDAETLLVEPLEQCVEVQKMVMAKYEKLLQILGNYNISGK